MCTVKKNRKILLIEEFSESKFLHNVRYTLSLDEKNFFSRAII